MVGASERDEFLRAARRALVAGNLEVRRFVFVNEMSTNISLLSMDGRRGRRAHFHPLSNWGTNLTLLSSMNSKEMRPSFAVEGSATCEVFGAYYVGRVLALALSQEQVMDNPLFPQGFPG